MFSKDISQSQHRTPRTLNDAFGPYAKLSVEPRKLSLRDKLLAFALFASVGAGWYVLVAIKAGGQ